VAEKDFADYGGETTCLLITGSGGERLVLDAGSGLRVVLTHLAAQPQASSKPCELFLLFSHYHIDHLIGLTALRQLYDPNWRIIFAAPCRSGEPGVETIIREFLKHPFWPVRWEAMRAEIVFTNLDATATDGSEYGGLKLRWVDLQHPGGSWAFRIDESETDASVVFATDCEWSQATTQERDSFLTLCCEPEPARLLVMDAQFGREDYEPHRGWGHSTREDVLAVAAEANVDRTLLTHHDTGHNDAYLAALDAHLRNCTPSVALARQSQEVNLP
jgi:ribonuclease BN (tRNA processing enzyme)